MPDTNWGDKSTKKLYQTLEWLLGMQFANQAGGPMGDVFASLNELIGRKGATDPGLMNQQLGAINRGTQAQQGQIAGQMANRGLSGSGLGMALQAAVGQGGLDRRAGLMNQEAQQQEQRRRQDLALFYEMVMGPQLDSLGMRKNYEAQSGTDWGAILGGGAQLAAGASGLPWGNWGGGKG